MVNGARQDAFSSAECSKRPVTRLPTAPNARKAIDDVIHHVQRFRGSVGQVERFERQLARLCLLHVWTESQRWQPWWWRVRQAKAGREALAM